MYPQHSHEDSGIRAGRPGDHHSVDEGIRHRHARQQEVAARRDPAPNDRLVDSEHSTPAASRRSRTPAVEIAFDGSVDLDQIIKENAPPVKKRQGKRPARAPWGVAVNVVDEIDEENAKKAWRCMSRRLVAERCRWVEVRVPIAHAHLTHVGGLLGQPCRAGLVGDDHWVREGVELDGGVLVVALRRPASHAAESRHADLVRSGVPFILAVAVPAGDRFAGLALPVAQTARRRVQSAPFATPSAAVASALQRALRTMSGDIWVYTQQHLVVDRTAKVKPPEIALELERLRQVEADRNGDVNYVQIPRSGQVLIECVKAWASKRFSML